MELIEKKTAKFKFGDAAVVVRVVASLGDKLAIDAIDADAEAALRRGMTPAQALAEMGRRVVRVFIEDWEGVTIGGKPVPYSYELLESGMPAARADDFMPALCRFVAANVDILKPKPKE